jgi:hypothetical protein
MAPVVIVAVVTLLLAVALGALLPGAGFVLAALAVLLGIGVIVWLIAASGAGRTPGEAVRRTPKVEHLGPGGPDDPSA